VLDIQFYKVGMGLENIKTQEYGIWDEEIV